MSHDTFVPRLHMAADNLRCGNKEKALEDIRAELDGGMTYRQVASYMSKHCKTDLTVEDLKELLGAGGLVAGMQRGHYVNPDSRGGSCEVARVRMRHGDGAFDIILAKGMDLTGQDSWINAAASWGTPVDVHEADIAYHLFWLMQEGFDIVGSMQRRD